MKIQAILFAFVLQLFAANQVSAFSIVIPGNTTNNTAYSYGYTYYPYPSNYYPSVSNNNAPRTVTIECKDNKPPVPGDLEYANLIPPTCNSITGEGSPTIIDYTYSNGKPKFSGYNNYRCISYYNNSIKCSVYRYETTYTPPVNNTQNYYPYVVYSPYQSPYIQPVSPIQIDDYTIPSCKNEQPGATYPAVLLNCSCPDGSVYRSKGGYHTCATGRITITPPVSPIQNTRQVVPSCKDVQPGVSYITLNIECSCPDGSINPSNGGYHTCNSFSGNLDSTVAPIYPTPVSYTPNPALQNTNQYGTTVNNDPYNYSQYLKAYAQYPTMY